MKKTYTAYIYKQEPTMYSAGQPHVLAELRFKIDLVWVNNTLVKITTQPQRKSTIETEEVEDVIWVDFNSAYSESQTITENQLLQAEAGLVASGLITVSDGSTQRIQKTIGYGALQKFIADQWFGINEENAKVSLVPVNNYTDI